MREFHHVGLISDKKRENETYIPDSKCYITDCQSHPFGVEWLRFEPDSSAPEMLKTSTHVAFKVDDLDKAIQGQNVLLKPFSPMEGVRVAFIVTEDAALIELMQA